MKYLLIALSFIICFSCQDHGYKPSIVKKAVPIENNTNRNWQQGWLAAPENRKADSSNIIEIPFVLSKVADSLKNDNTAVLIMSGGPGNGSLHMANGSVYASWGKTRDLLVMEQRGTMRANPSLMCPEIDSLRIMGLKNGLFGKSLDSLKRVATKSCYDKFIVQGIDLNGYNTLESVEDIEDLRRLLKLDQLILYGMSYSCNLMATYAQKYPQKVKALILDSPLPHQSDHDEEVYQNIDSTLVRLINHFDGRASLYNDWKNYLMQIKDSVFEVTIDSSTIFYTRNEIIDLPINAMSSHDGLKNTIPAIEKIIAGDYEDMKENMGYYLGKTRQAKGMRYSVWIGEELPEENELSIEQNMRKVEWMTGYAANDVSFETMKYWPVKSIYDQWEWPKGNYEGPTLILSGEFDPWTPVWYGKMMLPSFPNATHSVYPEHSHLPGFTKKGTEDISDFLNSITPHL
ncbi:MAG: alpha/beta hydrolase [Bacteroidia bacterium]|nr:alpha/beta hydrolase [Bacteroidia bacterium]